MNTANTDIAAENSSPKKGLLVAQNFSTAAGNQQLAVEKIITLHQFLMITKQKRTIQAQPDGLRKKKKRTIVIPAVKMKKMTSKENKQPNSLPALLQGLLCT